MADEVANEAQFEASPDVYFYSVADPSPDEFDYLAGDLDRGYEVGSNIKVFNWSSPWIYNHRNGPVLELYSPDHARPHDRGPRVSIVLFSDGAVSYTFSYWALPRHRANVHAPISFHPQQDTSTNLFSFQWSHRTARNCPGRHHQQRGTLGSGKNRFELVYYATVGSNPGEFWADCRPGINWDDAELIKAP